MKVYTTYNEQKILSKEKFTDRTFNSATAAENYLKEQKAAGEFILFCSNVIGVTIYKK